MKAIKMSILAQSPLLKYSVYSIPFALSGAWYYFYEDRKTKLDNPITERAIKVLQSDKRVVDFWGDNIQPGWMIKK